MIWELLGLCLRCFRTYPGEKNNQVTVGNRKGGKLQHQVDPSKHIYKLFLT